MMNFHSYSSESKVIFIYRLVAGNLDFIWNTSLFYQRQNSHPPKVRRVTSINERVEKHY